MQGRHQHCKTSRKELQWVCHPDVAAPWQGVQHVVKNRGGIVLPLNRSLAFLFHLRFSSLVKILGRRGCF